MLTFASFVQRITNMINGNYECRLYRFYVFVFDNFQLQKKISSRFFNEDVLPDVHIDKT
jgi:hypothetical protein